jgi:hypothetical protein
MRVNGQLYCTAKFNIAIGIAVLIARGQNSRYLVHRGIMNDLPREDLASDGYGMRSASVALRSQTAERREGLTPPTILSIVRGVAVGFDHEVATSTKEAVW